jgi:hypothetical protein
MKKKRRPTRLAKRTLRNRSIVREISPRIAATVPKDFAEARTNISDLVRGSAIEIVGKLIELAIDGELAPAKYLFEMVGLYPASAETSSKPEESLAYTLLQRMGLPPEPEGLGDENLGG